MEIFELSMMLGVQQVLIQMSARPCTMEFGLPKFIQSPPRPAPSILAIADWPVSGGLPGRLGFGVGKFPVTRTAGFAHEGVPQKCIFKKLEIKIGEKTNRKPLTVRKKAIAQRKDARSADWHEAKSNWPGQMRRGSNSREAVAPVCSEFSAIDGQKGRCEKRKIPR